MKSFLLYLLIPLSFILKSYSQEKSTSTPSSRTENYNISQIIEANTSKFPNNTQIAIALIDDDNTNYIGVIKEDDTLRSVENKNKVFEIGSISKVFTSIMLSHLVHLEKLSLDDTLESLFDFELKDGKNIQIKQLTNHTSGLPRLPSNSLTLMGLNKNNPYKYYTPELLEDYLKEDIFLLNPVGEKSAYSNLGVGLLGYILTQKTNKTYENLLHELILDPLGMNQSSSKLKKIEEKDLVKGLDEEGNIVSNWEFTEAFVGAGGIMSSVKDMEKFIHKNFENNSAYNLAQNTTFTINNNLKMGLGWFIVERKDNKILWHNGGTGGYRSYLAINKTKKQAVILLSNVSAFNSESSKIDELGYKLLKTLN